MNLPIQTNIKDLLSFYREEQRIYGRCPHCNEVFRLSEVKLTYGKTPPKDHLDRMKKERDRLLEQVERLQDEIEENETDAGNQLQELSRGHKQEKKSLNERWDDRMKAEKENWQLRLQSLDEKWTTKVDSAVDKRLSTKIKEIRSNAISRSRVTTLGKTIEKIAPMFSGFGYHPSDVRPIFEPIDFVIFNGLYEDDVREIVFVEFKTGSSQLTKTQRNIRTAINNRRVKFEERRMSANVISMLESGKPVNKLRAIEKSR